MTSGTKPDQLLPDYVRQRIKHIRNRIGGGWATICGRHLVQDAVVRNLQTLVEPMQRLSSLSKRAEPSFLMVRSPASATHELTTIPGSIWCSYGA